MLKRIEGADRDGRFEAVPGILHAAMALYLARYLDAPPAEFLAMAAPSRAKQTTQGRMNDLFSRPIWERMKLSGSAPSNLPSTTTVLFE
jgi:hypothetical protein